MLRIGILVFATALAAGSVQAAPTVAEQAHERAEALRANEPLVRELAAMFAIDQEMRMRFLALRRDASEADRAALDEVWTRDYEPFDAANTTRLKQLIEGRGWFTYSEVGKNTAEHAFHLVQHSGDLPLMKRVLGLMEPLLARHEADPGLYALLYDRIATSEDRPQRYGTQGTDCEDGKYVAPRNIEDPANLDARRKAADLPPMADYLREQNQFYGRCTPPG